MNTNYRLFPLRSYSILIIYIYIYRAIWVLLNRQAGSICLLEQVTRRCTESKKMTVQITAYINIVLIHRQTETEHAKVINHNRATPNAKKHILQANILLR